MANSTYQKYVICTNPRTLKVTIIIASSQEKNVMKTDISYIIVTVKTIIGYLITIEPQTNNNLFLSACTTTNNDV